MEESLYDFVNWMATQFPVVALVLMVLGTLFVLAEIVVRLTPTKKDDEAWARLKAGYSGAVIRVLMRFSKVKKTDAE